MAVHISLGRTCGPRVGGGGGGGGGWAASERATNEKIQRKSDPHGAQSDKNTLKPGNKGSSYEEACTNGPIKCERLINGTPPPPYPKQEGHGQTLPLEGRGTRKPHYP